MILVSISVITSVGSGTLLLYGIIDFDQSRNFYVIANLFITLDTFINALCFMLQFSFNNKVYLRLCFCCHQLCYKRFRIQSSHHDPDSNSNKLSNYNYNNNGNTNTDMPSSLKLTTVASGSTDGT